jgi:serine/threonine protein phosphatase PrpC
LFVWKQLTPSVPQLLPLGVACGMTDTGLVRHSNQDNFLIAPDIGLLAIADGMGGHEGGDVASADALEALAHFLEVCHAARPDLPPHFQPSAFDPTVADPGVHWTDASLRAMIAVHDAMAYANNRVFSTNLANRRDDGAGMGTTLTGLWQPAPDGPAYIFHVGDTRLYLLRDGRLSQLTRDQTMYQLALETGAVDNLPGRNLLLQALGPSAEIVPALQTQAVRPGDRFLLCSDGLHGASSDEAIGAILATTDAGNIEAGCARLIELAKRDASRDNITVVIVCCGA